MTKIKLREWADKNGISYLTANRHFHAGMIPGATQLDSGTILVEDDSPEQAMAGNSSNDAMSLFIKKTVEFSKNNSSVEDFAAYIVATFQLKLQGSETPRYSKNRPKPEDVQKHFQQFLPDQKEVEHLKAVKTLIKEGKTAGEVVPASNLSPEIAELSERLGHAKPFERVSPISEYPVDDFSLMLATAEQDNLQVPPTEGLVSRSVDFNTTPQQINYTGSTGQPFSFGGQVTVSAGMGLGTDTSTGKAGANYVANNSFTPTAGAAYLASNFVASTCDASLGFADGAQGVFFNAAGPVAAASPPFQPTQKELQSAAKVIETADAETTPRKRGRKPAFKKE